MFVGGYLEYTKHPKGPIVMGLGVLFLSFVFTSSVRLRKKGTFPMVSIATKNNIKEFIKAADI